jgi:hypothetical protein
MRTVASAWKLHLDRAIAFEKQLDESAVHVQVAKLNGDLPLAREWMAKEVAAHKAAGAQVTQAAEKAIYSSKTAFGDISIAVSQAGRDHMNKLAKSMKTDAERKAAAYVAQAEEQNLQEIQSAVADTGRSGTFSPSWREMMLKKVTALASQYSQEHDRREDNVHAANKDLGAYFHQAGDTSLAGDSQEMSEVGRAANEATAVESFDKKLAEVAAEEIADAKSLSKAEDDVAGISSDSRAIGRAGRIAAGMLDAQKQGEARLHEIKAMEGPNLKDQIQTEELADHVMGERQQRLRLRKTSVLTGLSHHAHHAHPHHAPPSPQAPGVSIPHRVSGIGRRSEEGTPSDNNINDGGGSGTNSGGNSNGGGGMLVTTVFLVLVFAIGLYWQSQQSYAPPGS